MEADVRPIHSHSNSFGNDAEKDTAGCRAFHRKSIVIGDRIQFHIAVVGDSQRHSKMVVPHVVIVPFLQTDYAAPNPFSVVHP